MGFASEKTGCVSASNEANAAVPARLSTRVMASGMSLPTRYCGAPSRAKRRHVHDPPRSRERQKTRSLVGSMKRAESVPAALFEPATTEPCAMETGMRSPPRGARAVGRLVSRGLSRERP